MDFFENYSDYEHGLAAGMLTLAMLGMGAKLTVGDFLTVLKVPKGFTVGMVLQVIIVPLVGWAMIQILGLAPGIAVGIALVAAMPGGSASNIFTHLGRGNAALSVALTCGATLTCLITTPFVFKLLAGEHISADIQMPYLDVVKEIFFFLLLPLAVGMLVCRFADKIKDGFSKWTIRASLLTVVLIIVGSVGAGRLKLDQVGLGGILAVVGFSVAAQQVSLWTTTLFRFPPADRLAIVIEVTIRNTLLGLLLYSTLFSQSVIDAADNPEELEKVAGGCLFVVLFYGGAAMAVAVPPMIYFKKRAIKEEEAAAAAAAAGESAGEAAGETADKGPAVAAQ